MGPRPFLEAAPWRIAVFAVNGGPPEALRVLLAHEAEGRDQSGREARRGRTGFPNGKTFRAWSEDANSISQSTQHAIDHDLKVTRFTLEDLGMLARNHHIDDTTRTRKRIREADLTTSAFCPPVPIR